MSVSEKVKCIDGNDKEHSISRQCELLQLPRSSYYWLRDCHIEDEENLELMRLIDEEFLRHPFFGSRKMKAYLSRRGFPVNHKLFGMNFIILSRTSCLENARAIASMILTECPACTREEAIYANPKAEEAHPASCSGSQLI